MTEEVGNASPLSGFALILWEISGSSRIGVELQSEAECTKQKTSQIVQHADCMSHANGIFQKIIIYFGTKNIKNRNKRALYLV